MADPLLDYLKQDFPQYTKSGKSARTSLEYIGPYATLDAGRPELGDAASAYGAVYSGNVSSVRLAPVEGTTLGELSVEFEEDFEAAESGATAGTATKKTYEVEWVSISRSMYEHPAFRLFGGGAYALTEGDVAEIEQWKNVTETAHKASYEFKATHADYWQTLSPHAQAFAKGVLLGIETWEDFAPVVRITTGLVNGGSASSSAGEKNNPPGFAGGPPGYEWRKSADRSVKSGKGHRWERVEEWIGTDKVLVDSKAIFYL